MTYRSSQYVMYRLYRIILAGGGEGVPIADLDIEPCFGAMGLNR